MKIPRYVKKIGKTLKANGFESYAVGGAVRNTLLGRAVNDYDIATNAKPHEIKTIFKRVIPTGEKHGTVTILTDVQPVEVTTYRTESTYSDSRHPDFVNFSNEIIEDLSRRDFTINAIAVNLDTGKTVDPFDGKSDLKKKIIKAIGIPVERFQEDALRTMRAVRFAGQLEFSIHEHTLKAISETAHTVKQISAERIRDELVKLITAVDPLKGLELMRVTGLLDAILPELMDCVGIEQKGYHDFDVYHHSLLACQAVDQKDHIVRMAALLHDIGKPHVMSFDDSGIVTFHNHETVSAQKAGDILQRLKFPKRDIHMICHLIKEHMFHYTPDWGDSAVRRFVKRVGIENIPSLFDLRRADQYGQHGTPPQKTTMHELSKRVSSVINQHSALGIKDLAVNGNQLNELAGIKKGPEMGKILELLLETVLDDPHQNEKETLIRIARNLHNEYFKK